MTVVDSQMERVTVYQQGARITRVAKVVAVNGVLPTQVEIARLPLALFDPTVRVRVLDAGGGNGVASATNVHVGLWVPPRSAPPDAPEEARIREVQRDITRLESQLNSLELEIGLLRSMPVPERPDGPEGAPPPPAPLAARLALEQFSDDAVVARTQDILKLRIQLRALHQTLEGLQDAAHRASSAREVTAADLFKSVTASLVVEGPSPSHVTLSLEYVVPGARWVPAYQCRMCRDCRQADVAMRAMVVQASGEDWRGVRLFLSTASPLSWTQLPELSSIRIGKAQPPMARKGFRPAPRGAAVLFQDFDRDRMNLLSQNPLPAHFLPQPLGQASSNGAVFGGLAAPAPERMKKGARRRDEESISYASSGMMAESAADMPAEMDDAADGMAAPPPPPPPPAPAMRVIAAAPMKEAKMAAPSRSASGGPKAAVGRGGSGVQDAALEMVAYASLRLQGPTSGPERGRLLPVDLASSYRESLARFDVVVTVDIMSAVEEATMRAANVLNVASPSGTVPPKSAAGNFDYTYSTDATVDVLSDGSFHSIPVGQRSATSSVVYVTVPREDPHVYREAEVRNPLQSPLLSGPAEVYVAGEYVHSTVLPTVAPNADFKLALGVEQAIKVSRNTTFKEQRSGNKVVATAELIHGIQVELVNNLDREVQCQVRERLPWPADNAEVVVEETRVQPAWEEYSQKERGLPLAAGRRWKVSIPAHGRQSLEAEYVVKLYANNELVGGNRRES